METSTDLDIGKKTLITTPMLHATLANFFSRFYKYEEFDPKTKNHHNKIKLES